MTGRGRVGRERRKSGGARTAKVGTKGKEAEGKGDQVTVSRLVVAGRRDDFRMIILFVARFFAKGTYYQAAVRNG